MVDLSTSEHLFHDPRNVKTWKKAKCLERAFAPCHTHPSRPVLIRAQLPSAAILRAAQTCLTTPSITVPALQYGPDPGYQPLREQLATWLGSFYSAVEPDPERICVSGGASQNLACLLQVYADPAVTTVWMVAPCYFLAKRVFEDAGLSCYDVGEGEEGVDLGMLEEEMRLCQHEGSSKVSERCFWI